MFLVSNTKKNYWRRKTISTLTRRDSNRARVNEQITTPEVRLIDANGEQVGVVSIKSALSQAQTAELDLVEISPKAQPPVCRIMDYGKYLFELSKKQALAKKKQKQIQVKEVKFRPTTEVGDYQVKLRNLRKFLDHGDKVKVTVRFRGREMMHQELGMKIMERLVEDTQDEAVVEQTAKREGRQLLMVLAPKKSK